MPFDRSPAEVFSIHKDHLKDEIRKCIPATVTAVNTSRQTVDVQLAIKNPLTDEYGNVTFEDKMGIADVPLAVMRGGGCFFWMPVAVGDSVLLVFSDLSYDTWRKGGDQPGWVGKHTADSPFAIPCIAPDAAALTIADPTKVIVSNGGVPAAVALATWLDQLITVLTATYTPAGVETGFASFLAALVTFKTAFTAAGGTVGSGVLKATP